MNTDELTSMLRDLPPALDDPADRLESVARRARRRARTRGAMAAGLVTAVVAAGAAAVLGGAPPTTLPDDGNVATEPPSPPESVRVDLSEPLPGATTAIELAEPVVVTASGTRAVDLGTRPDRATAAQVSVVCLTPGRITYPDGAALECDDPASAEEVADPTLSNYALVDLVPGQTSLTFRAADGVGWKVVATYVRTETTPWGVNAKGETYGVQRDGRSPDLLAVVTTDGQQGYAYVADLDAGTRPVPVYESDGETLIGEFGAG